MIKDIFAAVGVGFLGYHFMKWYADREVRNYAEMQERRRRYEAETAESKAEADPS